MPQTNSIKKRQRQNKKNNQYNSSWKTKARSAINDFEEALEEDEKEESLEELARKAKSLLDKLVSKGIFHENKSARKKSQIDQKLNRAINS